MSQQKTLSPNELSNSGLKYFNKSQYQQAIDAFQAALDGYTEINDEVKIAETKNNLSVAYLKIGNPQKAFDFSNGTEITFQNVNDKKSLAMALGNQAAALEGLNKYQEAMELYKKCSEILKDTGEKELRSYVLNNLSALQLKHGEQLEAVATMQAAINSKKNLSLKEKVLKKLLDVPFRLFKN